MSFNFMYIKLKAVNDFILFCHQNPISYVVSFLRLGSAPIVPSMVLLRKRALVSTFAMNESKSHLGCDCGL